jgi:hypothetical protein
MPQSSLRRALLGLVALAVFAPLAGAQEPAAGGRELTPPPLRYDPNDPRINLKPAIWTLARRSAD